MTNKVRLPGVFFESPFLDNADTFRLCCYLYAMADESGLVRFSSGDAWIRFRLTPRRFRSIVNLLRTHNVAHIETNNKTTSITFDATAICTASSKPKRTAKCTAKRTATTNETSSITLSNRLPGCDFINPLFADAFRTWIDYKSNELKEHYKTQRSLQAAYERLVELSGDDPNTAMRIVEQSMANRWKGLFELKHNGNKQANHTVDRRKIDQYSELEYATNSILCQSAHYVPSGDD